MVRIMSRQEGKARLLVLQPGCCKYCSRGGGTAVLHLPYFNRGPRMRCKTKSRGGGLDSVFKKHVSQSRRAGCCFRARFTGQRKNSLRQHGKRLGEFLTGRYCLYRPASGRNKSNRAAKSIHPAWLLQARGPKAQFFTRKLKWDLRRWGALAAPRKTGPVALRPKAGRTWGPGHRTESRDASQICEIRRTRRGAMRPTPCRHTSTYVLAQVQDWKRQRILLE